MKYDEIAPCVIYKEVLVEYLDNYGLELEYVISNNVKLEVDRIKYEVGLEEHEVSNMLYRTFNYPLILSRDIQHRKEAWLKSRKKNIAELLRLIPDQYQTLIREFEKAVINTYHIQKLPEFDKTEHISHEETKTGYILKVDIPTLSTTKDSYCLIFQSLINQGVFDNPAAVVKSLEILTEYSTKALKNNIQVYNYSPKLSVTSHEHAINILKQCIKSIEEHHLWKKAKNRKKRLEKRQEKERMRLLMAKKGNIES